MNDIVYFADRLECIKEGRVDSTNADGSVQVKVEDEPLHTIAEVFPASHPFVAASKAALQTNVLHSVTPSLYLYAFPCEDSPPGQSVKGKEPDLEADLLRQTEANLEPLRHRQLIIHGSAAHRFFQKHFVKTDLQRHFNTLLRAFGEYVPDGITPQQCSVRNQCMVLVESVDGRVTKCSGLVLDAQKGFDPGCYILSHLKHFIESNAKLSGMITQIAKAKLPSPSTPFGPMLEDFKEALGMLIPDNEQRDQLIRAILTLEALRLKGKSKQALEMIPIKLELADWQDFQHHRGAFGDLYTRVFQYLLGKFVNKTLNFPPTLLIACDVDPYPVDKLQIQTILGLVADEYLMNPNSKPSELLNQVRKASNTDESVPLNIPSPVRTKSKTIKRVNAPLLGFTEMENEDIESPLGAILEMKGISRGTILESIVHEAKSMSRNLTKATRIVCLNVLRCNLKDELDRLLISQACKPEEGIGSAARSNDTCPKQASQAKPKKEDSKKEHDSNTYERVMAGQTEPVKALSIHIARHSRGSTPASTKSPPSNAVEDVDNIRDGVEEEEKQHKDNSADRNHLQGHHENAHRMETGECQKDEMNPSIAVKTKTDEETEQKTNLNLTSSSQSSIWSSSGSAALHKQLQCPQTGNLYNLDNPTGAKREPVETSKTSRPPSFFHTNMGKESLITVQELSARKQPVKDDSTELLNPASAQSESSPHCGQRFKAADSASSTSIFRDIKGAEASSMFTGFGSSQPTAATIPPQFTTAKNSAPPAQAGSTVTTTEHSRIPPITTTEASSAAPATAPTSGIPASKTVTEPNKVAPIAETATKTATAPPIRKPVAIKIDATGFKTTATPTATAPEAANGTASSKTVTEPAKAEATTFTLSAPTAATPASKATSETAASKTVTAPIRTEAKAFTVTQSTPTSGAPAVSKAASEPAAASNTEATASKTTKATPTTTAPEATSGTASSKIVAETKVEATTLTAASAPPATKTTTAPPAREPTVATKLEDSTFKINPTVNTPTIPSLESATRDQSLEINKIFVSMPKAECGTDGSERYQISTSKPIHSRVLTKSDTQNSVTHEAGDHNLCVKSKDISVPSSPFPITAATPTRTVSTAPITKVSDCHQPGKAPPSIPVRKAASMKSNTLLPPKGAVSQWSNDHKEQSPASNDSRIATTPPRPSLKSMSSPIPTSCMTEMSPSRVTPGSVSSESVQNARIKNQAFSFFSDVRRLPGVKAEAATCNDTVRMAEVIGPDRSLRVVVVQFNEDVWICALTSNLTFGRWQRLQHPFYESGKFAVVPVKAHLLIAGGSGPSTSCFILSTDGQIYGFTLSDNMTLSHVPMGSLEGSVAQTVVAGCYIEAGTQQCILLAFKESSCVELNLYRLGVGSAPVERRQHFELPSIPGNSPTTLETVDQFIIILVNGYSFIYETFRFGDKEPVIVPVHPSRIKCDTPSLEPFAQAMDDLVVASNGQLLKWCKDDKANIKLISQGLNNRATIEPCVLARFNDAAWIIGKQGEILPFFKGEMGKTFMIQSVAATKLLVSGKPTAGGDILLMSVSERRLLLFRTRSHTITAYTEAIPLVS